ncbi:hypothetical protein NQ315_010334 [Exocentrus adspersus]|uniref:Transcription initiation factor IIA subunit 1 n=1 Tax=Exocentrus adspersus TaxID=1586481 RepID=A0AAV8WAX8_9CUCU|nr:hypothetical protein NQ315_010334 [Exocentrus adspersus]
MITKVYKAYQDVINDVITNAREHFIEDGVDEAVLQELKQTWQSKLSATKAVEENKEPEKIITPNNKVAKQDYSNGIIYNKPQQQVPQQQMQVPQQHQQQNLQQHQQHQMLNQKQVVGQVAPNNHMPQGPLGQAFPEWRRVPIQLTIPSAPGTGEGHRILSIDVPEVFLQGHHLKSILTGQVISTTMGLPPMAACAFLQEHVNSAFINHQQSFFDMNSHQILQSDMIDDKVQRLHEIPQRDGPADSSDEDDDKSDEASEDGEDDKVDDEVEDDGAAGVEEEPLNSGDDVSDADGTEESFETENVIVCQYDKITRSRNRWKFHLKDGIMNLNGEDYVFQKANGDAEW